MMNYGDEFRKYAIHHKGMSSNYLDDYLKKTSGLQQMPSAFTPYIIEERPMNIAQMDVFSRLMMDRIIFFGVPVTDQTANIVQAQLLFLESVDPKRDVYMLSLIHI